MNKPPERQAMQLSSRIQNLKSSPVREILSVIHQPGMISFAGGLPAAEAMPQLSLATLPNEFLQYGESEGEIELRKLVAAQMCKEGLKCSFDQVLILSGSQQGIDLAAKLFVEEGSKIAVEAPTYLAALQVFRFFGASFNHFDITTEELSAIGRDCRLLYTIPTFRNPSGYCYSSAERKRLARLCESSGLPVFEDDPYRDLKFGQQGTNPVCGYMKQGSWLYQGSFSKNFAPGLRLGFMVSSEDLCVPLGRLKQAADLHSCRVSQWLVTQFLKDSSRDQHLASLQGLYRGRRDSFNRSLVTHFSKLASWEIPEGGLFYWLRLNRPVDLDSLLTNALREKVAFMPGNHFFANQRANDKDRYIRLNFSHADAAKAELGLAILAQIVRNHGHL